MAVTFEQDDGERQQVRAVHRAGGGLAAGVDLLPPQPGSARELEVAGDGAGSALAVWTEEHRGGPAVFAVAWGGYYRPLQTRFATGPAAAAWEPVTDVGVWVQQGGVNHGPTLATGPAGFGAVWTNYYEVWTAVSTNGATWAEPVLVDRPTTSCSLPTMAPLADGFVAAWDCRGARARVWRNGWSAAVSLTATDTAAMRLASGAPGMALLLRESVGGALRGTTWRAGAWAPLETLRGPVSGEPALSWDGEAWLTGWIEADAADSTIDRVVVRRGL